MTYLTYLSKVLALLSFSGFRHHYASFEFRQGFIKTLDFTEFID